MSRISKTYTNRFQRKKLREIAKRSIQQESKMKQNSFTSEDDYIFPKFMRSYQGFKKFDADDYDFRSSSVPSGDEQPKNIKFPIKGKLYYNSKAIRMQRIDQQLSSTDTWKRRLSSDDVVNASTDEPTQNYEARNSSQPKIRIFVKGGNVMNYKPTNIQETKRKNIKFSSTQGGGTNRSKVRSEASHMSNTTQTPSRIEVIENKCRFINTRPSYDERKVSNLIESRIQEALDKIDRKEANTPAPCSLISPVRKKDSLIDEKSEFLDMFKYKCRYQKKKKWTYKIKESSIPIDVIFHEEVSKVKNKEILDERHHKTISFRYFQKGRKRGRVYFTVEGDNEPIESTYICKTISYYKTFKKNAHPSSPFHSIEPVELKKRKNGSLEKKLSLRNKVESFTEIAQDDSETSDSFQELVITEKSEESSHLSSESIIKPIKAQKLVKRSIKAPSSNFKTRLIRKPSFCTPLSPRKLQGAVPSELFSNPEILNKASYKIFKLYLKHGKGLSKTRLKAPKYMKSPDPLKVSFTTTMEGHKGLNQDLNSNNNRAGSQPKYIKTTKANDLSSSVRTPIKYENKWDKAMRMNKRKGETVLLKSKKYRKKITDKLMFQKMVDHIALSKLKENHNKNELSEEDGFVPNPKQDIHQKFVSDMQALIHGDS
ncbi:unnamed protein product [Moneuplotes crassus]|uniref:Uncharacterized protein n=1 Tax=Euplotes crassus TaxID=5936 RepID=A0AAD1Y665_EUPCR|nr:unnamed protein product [Moneuplotes crassus]